ncbi:MAG TPA: ABC transporter permease, partial [Candidatus Acidoferrum sp.]|nr:ABC transporter permease [Candidatus Acidoferrum sp.]
NGVPVSYTKFTQIQEQGRTLESAAAYYVLGIALATQHEPEVIFGAHVSQYFFDVLGVHAARGRTFLPEEQKPGGPDVAVVTDAFWHSYFAGDESLVGRTLTLDGKSVTVVGILPATFKFPLQFPEPGVWLPREFENTTLRPDQIQSGAGYLTMIGRLRPGESLARAQAELETINSRYRAQYGSYVDATKYDLSATSLEESLVSGLRPSLLVLLAAVGFVLLIACANVANLLLARATGREREIAIRKALGASRPRLVRQLLIESFLLSVGGSALGVFLSSSLLPLVRSLNPGTFPRISEVRVDAAVLLFSLALCAVTGIIFGLGPSLQSASKTLQSSLKEGGRGASEGGSRGKFRSLLVIAEMGVALVLMTGAGLLIESFAHLVRVDPGFSPKSLMTFPINLPTARYPQPQQQAQFYKQLLERVRSLPEVQGAGATSYLPLSGAIRFVFFCPEGHVCQGVGKDPIIATRQVTPDYFDTARTPLLSGRVFGERDGTGAQPVVIVNETTAKRYWPDQNPIGKHLANSRDMIPREVIGVVADVKFNTLNAANSEEMYLPLAQSPWPAMTLVVRLSGEAHSLVSAVRAKIAEVDPMLPVSGILSMEDVVSTSIAQPRLIMQFVGGFAGLALLLSAIGIYGVMAYSVTQRKQELGIRVALGAEPRDILRLVVGQGMKLALAGVALGVVTSVVLTRLMSTLLFGVRAIDPLAFVGSALGLVIAAFVACYLPARRATRADPIVVLRFE